MDFLTAAIVRLIRLCTHHAWAVVAVAVVVTVASAAYSVRHFAMNTDINTLISSHLPWRQREISFEKLFPQFDVIAVVVEAPTPELTDRATALLVERLSQRGDLFRSVSVPGGGEFFARNGLLFQPEDALKQLLDRLTAADSLIQVLAGDPSLRGLTQALSFGLMGTQSGRITLDDMAKPMTAAAETVEHVLAGESASFSWRTLVAGQPPGIEEVRHIVVARPKLDYGALEPGAVASDAIRQAAKELDPALRARVRLTGPVPMADEEFATIKENALLNGIGTVLVVLFILWRALGSGRTIVAVFASLVVGLAATAAVGMMLVGALNLISVYFAVLFVGLGVDFGIQFSVRYRAERHDNPDLQGALIETGRRIAAPLTLAACATAAGFLSFLPTDYKGVSELGLIAGFGMLIAFATSVTLLPALLALLQPPGEPEALGYPVLAPIDRFMDRHRMAILVGTLGVIVLASPLLFWVGFDFNPLNLRSPKVESVATFLDLRNDPAGNVNAAEVLAPSLDEAHRIADKLRGLPVVARVITLSSFIPQQQDQKLPLIQKAAQAVGPSLNPDETDPAPADDENVAALTTAAQSLDKAAAAAKAGGPGATAARRLAGDLSALAKAQPAKRTAAEQAFVVPLKTALDGLRALLSAQRVSLETLPPDLRRDWMTPDGRTRVELTPKGDPNDTDALRSFADAVLAVQPDTVLGPISILESGKTIVHAFFVAGGCALISITILLWIALRRFGDVLLTLIPLLLAGVVTLELCVVFGLPLNFANIIALPLLLGVGVAFKIYYIMAWREGQTNLLQSVLTRAVMFSAATTATAFGSLWLSSHPGTSSMGKLLALSLACTLAAAALFQPILMGKPRSEAESGK